jgi:ketosteroid isomerase-like protein
MSHDNTEVVRRFFDAYLRRDREAVSALLHPGVVWHTIAAPLFGIEALHGRAEMLRFMFEQIPEELPDFQATLDEVTELGGDQVLSVARYVGHGVSSRARVEMTSGGLYRFDSGMIVLFREFASRDEALKAARSPE